MNRLIAFFVDKRVFVDVFSVMLVLVGIGSLFLIKREVFPSVTFDIITISVEAPGSSATEVEKLITNPLEQDLKEVDGIKKLQSISIEGRSQLVAQLDPDQTTEQKGKADIQDVVDRFPLPAGVLQPIVTSVKSDQTPIIEVVLGGNLSPLELREKARELEKQIEALPGVARVVTTGLRKKEIHVAADLRKLSRYRLTLDDLVRSLRGQNQTLSAGVIEADPAKQDPNERLVKVSGEFKSLDDIRNTVIRANESAVAISVGDVANIYYDLERASLIMRTNSKPSLNLTVLKKAKADAIQLVDDLQKRIEELRPTLGAGLEVSFVNDFSSFIRRRISVLSGNLFVGLGLVLLILGALLQIRVAVLVSLGIPFSFLGTLFLFYNFDNSLNLVSLIGLIIVSGMLVDDAIVVTDNAVRLMDEGMSPRDAAVVGTQQIWPAVTASVLTTVVAFLPMMFMSGIFGKFIKEIPLGVILALLISLSESFFILPAHIAHYIQRPKAQDKTKRRGITEKLSRAFADFWDERIVPRYVAYLTWIINRRYTALFATLLLFIATIGTASKMRFILFPPDGIEIFFMRFQGPTGASLDQMETLIKPAEGILSELSKKELDAFVTMIGMQAEDANDPAAKRGSEFAQIAVYLTPAQGRARSVSEVIAALRPQIEALPGFVRVSFDQVQGGPPVGKPVSISVRSSEYEDILPAVKDLKEFLKTVKGVTDIGDSYVLGKEEIVLKINASEAAAAGLSVADIGTTVRAGFAGIESTSIKGLDEEIKVRVLLPKDARADDATLKKILVPNFASQLIPLSSVATFETDRAISQIQHDSNEREVKVTGEVDANKTSAVAANAEAKKYIESTLRAKYPKTHFAFGGEDEDTKESMQSLMRAFAVAGMAIFLILVFTFQNLLQPILVLLTIPLGIMAVVITFLVHGKPLSFMGMLGIIALGGVIVNNAIILVDFVNEQRKKGIGKIESILNSAKVRIRPIFLTTSTTVAGLLPTAYGIGGRDDFVVPIALALGWGLLVGSALAALVVPVAMAALDDFEAFLDRRFASSP